MDRPLAGGACPAMTATEATAAVAATSNVAIEARMRGIYEAASEKRTARGATPLQGRAISIVGVPSARVIVIVA